MVDFYFVQNETNEAAGENSPVHQVWGAVAHRYDIPVVRQPVDGAVNLYTHGRSHFVRPDRELAVHVGHGVADKGNWLHHARRFDTSVVPGSWLRNRLGDNGFPAYVGGIPALDNRRDNAGSLTHIVVATTIEPRSGSPYTYASDEEEAAFLVKALWGNAPDGFSIHLTLHPSTLPRSKRRTVSLDLLSTARAVVADAGSVAHLATALRVPVIVPEWINPEPGTLEDYLLAKGVWKRWRTSEPGRLHVRPVDEYTANIVRPTYTRGRAVEHWGAVLRVLAQDYRQKFK